MRTRVLGLAAAIAYLALGCGDDTKTTLVDASTDGGAKPDSGVKKDAGTAPRTDSGTMVMTAMPVPCGTRMCTAAAGIGGLLGGLIPGGGAGLIPTPVACCLNESTSTCGTTTMTGGTCEAPATADMRCKSIDLGGFQALAGNMGFGCCTSSGRCGIDGSAFGRGCVENGEAMTMLGPLSAFLMPPPAGPCSAGNDEDGGSGAVDAGR